MKSDTEEKKAPLSDISDFQSKLSQDGSFGEEEESDEESLHLQLSPGAILESSPVQWANF